MGTDLHWDKTFWDQQKEAFKIQVDLAKKYKLPIVIHCRKTLSDTIDLVEKLKDDDLVGVFHCFTGNEQQASRITEIGFYLGVGGVLTFKNSNLDQALKNIDPGYLLLETDSPYLAPDPYRGKRNEPSYLVHVAKKLAEVLNVSLEQVNKITTENANRLFRLEKWNLKESK